MTLTAPVPTFDLAALVKAGRPVTATARVQGTVTEARAAVHAAIERNLAGLRITPDDGTLLYLLEQDRHGWQVTGVWRAR